MNIQELSKRYPWTIANPDSEWVYGNCETESWLGEFPPGWWKAFGEQMIAEIDEVLKKYNIENFEINQIKQKFATLRFYYTLTDIREANKELNAIISKYEHISAKTCIYCGRPAHFMSCGYILPFCWRHIGTKFKFQLNRNYEKTTLIQIEYTILQWIYQIRKFWNQLSRYLKQKIQS